MERYIGLLALVLFPVATFTSHYEVPHVGVSLLASGLCTVYLTQSETFIVKNGNISKSTLELVEDTFNVWTPYTMVRSNQTNITSAMQTSDQHKFQVTWLYRPVVAPERVTFRVYVMAMNALTTAPHKAPDDPRNTAYLTWELLGGWWNVPIQRVTVRITIPGVQNGVMPQLDPPADVLFRPDVFGFNTTTMVLTYPNFTAPACSTRRLKVWFADANRRACPRVENLPVSTDGANLDGEDPKKATSNDGLVVAGLVIAGVFAVAIIAAASIGLFLLVRCVHARRVRRMEQDRLISDYVVNEAGLPEVDLKNFLADVRWHRRRNAFLIRCKSGARDPDDPEDLVILRDIPPELFRLVVMYL